MRRRSFLFTSLACLLSRRLGAQQPPDFSSNVTVVNLFVSVSDGSGRIVPNLTQGDFTLEEDGRPQTIRYFSQQSGIPLTLGLLVDTSASMLRVIDTEHDAAHRFLRQVIREEKDHAFVIQFDREVTLTQDLTSSRRKVDRALSVLTVPAMQERFKRARNSGEGHHTSTALYDAILLGSKELMAKQTGRKAVILLSDGLDAGSIASLAQAIEAAQRADTVVYSIRIYAESPDPLPMRTAKAKEALARGKQALSLISGETGGGYFEVSSDQPLTQIFGRIEEELRTQYNLGYTPDRSGNQAGFRKIRLTAKPGLVVRTRDGYYG